MKVCVEEMKAKLGESKSRVVSQLVAFRHMGLLTRHLVC